MDFEEPAANPADGGEATPVTEAALAPQEADTTDLDALAAEALGETGATPTVIETEIDGRKVKLEVLEGDPLDPDFKPGLLRDADYRKKTMTLAEERKALQQEREHFSARANLEGQAALRATNLAALDAQVRQLSQVSLDDLRMQGWTEEQISEAAGQLQNLRGQRDNLANMVNRDIHQMQEQQRASYEKARVEAVKQAGMEDKAITQDRASHLEQWAISKGLAESEARSITDPLAYRFLHLAEVGERFLERQRKAANMRAAATGSPVNTLGGVVAGGKSPEAMSFEEFAAWRDAGNG